MLIIPSATLTSKKK